MQHELQAFRRDVADPPSGVEARARRRLKAAIRAESAVRKPARRRAVGAHGLAAAALAVAVVLAAAVAWPQGEERLEAGSGIRIDELRVLAPAPGRHLSERSLRGARPARSDADGLLLALPSLDGREAGLRPPDERGGWSECATRGCYLES